MVEYLRFDNEVDNKLKSLISSTMYNGFRKSAGRASWSDGIAANTMSQPPVVLQYSKEEVRAGLLVPSIQHVPLRTCLKELEWIWCDKSNDVRDLHAKPFPTKIWDQWAGEDHTIGHAYGWVLRQRHQFPEGIMDQVDWTLHQLQHNPSSRRMVISMFDHSEYINMGLAPCAYSITLNVSEGGKELNMILNQRSLDIMVAFGWNTAQYSYLHRKFADAAGMKSGTFTHVIADPHIYDRHFGAAEEVLGRETIGIQKVPVLHDSKEYSTLQDTFYTRRHTAWEFGFTLEEGKERYPSLKLPVAD